jgi:hypothetical protein
MSYGTKPESLTVKLDIEQLLFEALRKVNNAFDSPEFVMTEHHTKFGGDTQSQSHIGFDRYENNVLNCLSYILPEWIEEDNKKFKIRYALWAEKVVAYLAVRAEWKKQYDQWQTTERNPLKEPMEPPDPTSNVFGDIEVPKPFSAEVRACKVNGVWKPVNLHHVILRFLHRKGFFKRFEVEIIEAGEAEPETEPEAVLPGQPAETPPVGGQSGATSATV